MKLATTLAARFSQYWIWKEFCGVAAGPAAVFIEQRPGEKQTLVILSRNSELVELPKFVAGLATKRRFDVEQRTGDGWRLLSGGSFAGSAFGHASGLSGFSRVGTLGAVAKRWFREKYVFLTAGHAALKCVGLSIKIDVTGGLVQAGALLDAWHDHRGDIGLIEVLQPEKLGKGCKRFRGWFGRLSIPRGLTVSRVGGSKDMKAEVVDSSAVAAVETHEGTACLLQWRQVVLRSVSKGAKVFAARGDSGSMIVDEEHRAIGLLTAVSENNEYYLVSPIRRVLLSRFLLLSAHGFD